MDIYLDASATTQPRAEVIEAMQPYFTDKWYNPSALYNRANKIKKDIEKARETIADFINAKSNEIYFTSSGSEGNCWAIQGFVNYCISRNKNPCVITSVIEHKSIIECVDNLNNTDIHYIGVDKEGFVNIEALENVLKHTKKDKNETLVSIQFANNEIGTIQHIGEISKLVHKYNAVFHTDTVQAFGHIHINVKELDIDMMTVSGHKIGAPKGIGFLYKKSSVNINPLIYGSQMDYMRGGTENVPYIIGIAKAVDLVKKDLKCNNQLKLVTLRNKFIYQLQVIGCTINGSLHERLPNNINVTLSQNVMSESLIYMLDTSGIYISNGSACNSNSIEASYVLKAIGLSDDEATRSIRITLPDNITMDEITVCMKELKKLIELLSSGVLMNSFSC